MSRPDSGLFGSTRLTIAMLTIWAIIIAGGISAYFTYKHFSDPVRLLPRNLEVQSVVYERKDWDSVIIFRLPEAFAARLQKTGLSSFSGDNVSRSGKIKYSRWYATPYADDLGKVTPAIAQSNDADPDLSENRARSALYMTPPPTDANARTAYDKVKKAFHKPGSYFAYYGRETIILLALW